MNANKNITARPGIALLAVLMIVMVITVMALGFLSRSDVELACGRNMEVRAQMDYLAESGLEHARGLILHPQDISEDWTGATAQQLVAGSDDYYDLAVDQDDTDFCNYTIDCNSYRLSGGERIGRSNLRATLRIDPAIAYWAGSDTTVSEQITINGDVYCNGSMANNGIINGDVFANGAISGLGISGQRTVVTEAPVTWPNLLESDFGPTYFLGAANYSAEIVDGNHPGGSFGPWAANPAGIRYCSGNLELPGDVNIIGTLVVTGDLTISGANNSITATKNYPALLVGGGVAMKDGSALAIRGLAQIAQQITADPNATSASIQVIGALFIANGGVTSDKILVNISAAPAIASIETWPAANTNRRWEPAGGAFFRSIERR